jgi:opacity protein-like surface antigen
MKNFRCFLVFICVLTAVPAYAQGDLTLFGATHSQGSLNLSTASSTATTTSNFDPRTFGVFGIRAGHGRIVGGEHTIAYAPNFLDSSSKAIVYNSNLILQVPTPKVKPYGTVGMGTIFSWGTDSAGRPAIGKIGNKFALNYGGGVKVFAAGPIGLRFDIRGYLIPDAKFNLPAPTSTDPSATVRTQGNTLNMLEVGLGLIFSSGGR